MARLRDAPDALRKVGLWGFAKRIWKQIEEDNLLTWAAAMAFSWLFAIFPFLIFLLTLLPFLPEKLRDEARLQLNLVVYRTLPEEAADTVQETVDDVLERPRGGWMSISIIMVLWVASGGMAMTMAALNKCYDVEVTRAFYVERPIAIGLTIATVILALMVLVLLPIGTIVTLLVLRWMWEQGRDVSFVLLWTWNIGRWGLGLILMLTVLALLYYFGATRVRHNFRLFSPGALFSIVVWVLLGAVFRFYVDNYGRYEHMYGALGGVVVLMMLFYLIALVLLIGAEINAEIDLIVRGEPEGASDPEVAPAVGEKG